MVYHLPTVRAIAKGSEGHPFRDIRLFGDGGSTTTTFVNEKLALELGVQLRPISPFRASVFGGHYTCAVSKKATMRICSHIDARLFNDVEEFVMRGTLVMPLSLPSKELCRVARSYEESSSQNTHPTSSSSPWTSSWAKTSWRRQSSIR